MVPDGELSIDKVKGPEIGIFAGDGKFRFYDDINYAANWRFNCDSKAEGKQGIGGKRFDSV